MHRHQWNEEKIENGSAVRKANTLSDGAKCACGLVAKSPTRATTDSAFKAWISRLPG